MSSKDASSAKLKAVLKAAAENMFPGEDEVPSIELDARAPDVDTPLHVFVWRGDIESARVLVEAGANVDAIGDMGEAPLHIALRKENEPLVALLLSVGAKTDIRSEFDETAVDAAMAIGGAFAKMLATESGNA